MLGARKLIIIKKARMGEDGEAGLTGLILPSLPSSARFQKNSSLVNGSSYLVG